jgi:class 3 adenylate cyclase
MSEIDAATLNWTDRGVSELVPTGTVTLLLADVEDSTRLWETQPDEMTAAFADLDRTLAGSGRPSRGAADRNSAG